MTATRRLAAILAADVAGYSRLMGADEEGTHERLKAHFAQLLDPRSPNTTARRHDHRRRPAGGILEAFMGRCAAEVQQMRKSRHRR
jgi:class 3 adenylate cyclase